MTPLLKIHFATSRKTQFVISLCLLLEKCTGVHNAYFTSDTGYRPSCIVFFASGVMTSTAGKSVLFVLQSRTFSHLLRPDGQCWVMF